MATRSKHKAAPDIETFRRILKDKGLKATPQRIAVHETMLELGHASADMVAERLSERDGVRITISSVYNILSSLAELKLYDRRLSANSKMFFDVNTFRHVHLYDTRNNEFRDIIDDELIAAVEAHFKERNIKGFKIDGVDIQLMCHPTRKSRKKA